ncbi:MAG: PP2C family protein-serine/threonine phosphatase [Lachnospiraceae bacterium]|nr:PP2C family protein-serine/threonine phosphatase [Lachnospiraceae bacterium]
MGNEIFLYGIIIICIFIILMLLLTFALYRRIDGWSNKNKKSDSDAAKNDNDAYKENEFGKDEIGDLVVSFNSMEGALKTQMQNVARMTAEKEKVQAELDVATRIQRDMLPTNFKSVKVFGNCDIYGNMTPAKEVGGDFYDFFPIDEDRLCIVIADVSGKGVPGALFMTISKVLIKQRAMSPGSPAQILSDVNNQLCQDNKEMLFVTVWLGIINTKTFEVDYCNAGHEYPVILRNGKATLVGEGENDPPLALAEDFPFTDRKTRLKAGDGLYVYTDGVPEAKGINNERYTVDRMLAKLEEADEDYECSTLIQNMVADMDEFVGGKEPFDDVTMLMVRIK